MRDGPAVRQTSDEAALFLWRRASMQTDALDVARIWAIASCGR